MINLRVVYDNEMMQKKMINTARNWGYDDGYDTGKADGIGYTYSRKNRNC